MTDKTELFEGTELHRASTKTQFQSICPYQIDKLHVYT